MMSDRQHWPQPESTRVLSEGKHILANALTEHERILKRNTVCAVESVGKGRFGAKQN